MEDSSPGGGGVEEDSVTADIVDESGIDAAKVAVEPEEVEVARNEMDDSSPAGDDREDSSPGGGGMEEDSVTADIVMSPALTRPKLQSNQ